MELKENGKDQGVQKIKVRDERCLTKKCSLVIISPTTTVVSNPEFKGKWHTDWRGGLKMTDTGISAQNSKLKNICFLQFK